MDSLLRSVFGLLWAWPCLWICQKVGFRSFPTAVILTVWMIPGWMVYKMVF